MAIGLERDGLLQVILPKTDEETITKSIPDRSSPISTRTVPAAAHQGGGEEYVTGISRDNLRARENIVIGTWNTRTLGQDGKIEELVHEMDRYNWNVR